jgi:hypothetical protein
MGLGCSGSFQFLQIQSSVRAMRQGREARHKPIDFDIDLKGENTTISDGIDDCTKSGAYGRLEDDKSVFGGVRIYTFALITQVNRTTCAVEPFPFDFVHAPITEDRAVDKLSEVL